MDKYKLLTQQGEGTFAVVWKAKRKSDGTLVAIKQLKESYTSFEQVKQLPEVKFLGGRSHPNVIKLLEVVRAKDHVFLVFEFCSVNLYQVMQTTQGSAKQLRESQIRWLMKGILQGLSYLHSSGICHRDIKPENVLLGSSGAKLCDFGQAIVLSEASGALSTYVSTRWYRAPELLLHEKRYSTSVDVWAAGAIMAELYALRPIFNGTSEQDQIFKIASTLNVPNSWRKKLELVDTRFTGADPGRGFGLEKLLPNASPEALEVISSMLKFGPQQRATADEILNMPYFRRVECEPVFEGSAMTTASESGVGERRAREAERAIEKLMEAEEGHGTTTQADKGVSSVSPPTVESTGPLTGMQHTHSKLEPIQTDGSTHSITYLETTQSHAAHAPMNTSAASNTTNTTSLSSRSLNKRKKKLQSKRLNPSKPTADYPLSQVDTKPQHAPPRKQEYASATFGRNKTEVEQPDSNDEPAGSPEYVPSCLDNREKPKGRRPHPLRQ